RLEESVQHFHDAEAAATSLVRTSPAYLQYFLAMAHHRLGHKEEAGKWLEKAVAQTDTEVRADAENTGPERWVRKPTLQLLRAEAEALLRRPAPGPEK